jgi:ribonucleoside-diphosphate reductase beta chain
MSSNKYSLFPIKNSVIWDAFKTHEAAFWTAEELDFSQDPADLKKLNENELHFIKHILAFFAQSDGIVNENLCLRFYNDVDIPEAKAFYSMQILIETIHAEVYGLLIDTYVSDEQEKEKLFDAISTIPTIGEKAQWALKWIKSQEDFAKRLVAFAVVEGIFFSGAFCAIYWLRKRGLLPGLANANDFIARDEGLHWTFAATLFKEMKLSVSKKEFEDIIKEAVEIEKKFICEALPVSLIGMNSDLMAQYIEYTADRVSQKFGYKTIYNSENPFDFMKLIDLEGKTNFFEKKVSEYQKPQDRNISFDSEF